MNDKQQISATHDAHWGAMMGFDWMFETPSLLFNEVDESKTVDTIDNLEYLEKVQGPLKLCTFLDNNHHLLSFPHLTSDHCVNAVLNRVLYWNKHKVESTTTIDVENYGELNTFCVNTWNLPSGNGDDKVKACLSALVYELKTTQSTAEFASIESKDDNRTSYSFSGATLTDIESCELFYHKGWLATIHLEFEDKRELKFKIWIHKKNTDTPPEEGVLYKGALWLQSSFEEIK